MLILCSLPLVNRTSYIMKVQAFHHMFHRFVPKYTSSDNLCIRHKPHEM